MANVQRHEAIVAKVHALRAKLLQPADYAEAIKSNDLNATLRKWYPDMPAESKVFQLETAFLNQFQSEIESIYSYYSFEYRAVLQRLLMRFEIEHIKRSLRAITTHDVTTHPPIILSSMLKHVDDQLFQQARTYRELADAMQYAPYRKIIESMKHTDEDRLFHAEMSLDKEYFRGLSDVRKKLQPEDRHILSEGVGVHVDMLNINWIRRAKSTFHISPEEIFNYTLSRGKRIGLKQQRILSYMSLTELDEWIARSPYREVFDGSPIGQDRRIERFLYRTLRALEQTYPISLAPVIAYLHEVEYQMRDLDMIVEARDYQVDVYNELLGRQVGVWR